MTLEQSPPTVYSFTAPTCGVCRAMRPDLHSVAADYADRIRFVEIDVSTELDLAGSMKVRGTPTLIARVGEADVFRASGARSRSELDEMFSGLLDGAPIATRSREDLIVRLAAGLVLVGLGVVLSAAPLVVIGILAATFGVLSWIRW